MKRILLALGVIGGFALATLAGCSAFARDNALYPRDAKVCAASAKCRASVKACEAQEVATAARLGIKLVPDAETRQMCVGEFFDDFGYGSENG